MAASSLPALMQNSPREKASATSSVFSGWTEEASGFGRVALPGAAAPVAAAGGSRTSSGLRARATSTEVPAGVWVQAGSAARTRVKESERKKIVENMESLIFYSLKRDSTNLAR